MPLAILLVGMTNPASILADEDAKRVALDRRVYGMLIGSVLADAAGGPVEFASHEIVAGAMPGFRHRPEVRLGAEDFQHLAETFPLLSYDPIRPGAEPYGQWTKRAPAGTATDDTRNKIVLLDALRQSLAKGEGDLSVSDLAASYLRFADRAEVKRQPGWSKLCEEGFAEFVLSARWIRGERDPSKAAPPARMWSGLGTCCGQMTLPPLAAIYPGEPKQAYLKAFELGFFDNGEGKDINSAFIAGLAFALGEPIPADTPEAKKAAWRAVLESMKRTDPYRYAEIQFMDRALVRWIDLGIDLAKQAHGSPAELYRLIDGAVPHKYAWEANFLLVEAVALGEFCDGEPLAAMHLALDYGQDTDSAAQFLGAIFGAIHGLDRFPAAMRRTVETRLQADYGESLAVWVEVLRMTRSIKAKAIRP